MRIIDLTCEFAELVKGARGTIEFKARFWTWLESQRREGALAPLLSDMERHWSTVAQALSHSEARDVLRHLATDGYSARVQEIGRRFREVTGDLPHIDVVLFAGLERPEGYSRFDRGRNTIFIGVDHPSALAHFDHLEVLLSHELCHAVRDPSLDVLEDYGGSPTMSHDDFVARHPFREHLVSEALATAISEVAYPGRPDRRYVYFEDDAIQWCEEHRRVIVERIHLALERSEPYRTFYDEGSVTPDSPDCCDYWLGLHIGRFALERATAVELLRMPATALLDRFLEPFVESFLRVAATRAVVPAPAEERAVRPASAAAGAEALDGSSLPSSVRRVYEEYAALIARRPTLARRLEEQFAEAVSREGLAYGDRPWSVHAFPLLLSAEEQRHLRWSTEGLLRIVERVIEVYRVDREVRAFFGFPRVLEEMCCLDPGYRPHVMLGRLDSFWSGRRIRFLELNANGAAGWVIAELLSQLALEAPGLGEILVQHGAEPSPLSSRILDGLLSAWRQVRGESAEPRRIAIVDWEGLATSTEHQRLASDFVRMGIDARCVPPHLLAFDGRELSCPAGPIDIVYRRLTTLDLIEHSAELKTLLEAASAGAVVTVGSYGSDIAHSKRLFVFLTHEHWQRRMSPEERSLIDAHVPWTRMFVPGKTQFEGRMRDLRELALSERERFVLKPAEGYEGRGVVLGPESGPAVWEAEVERRFGGAHVIQEVVRAPLRRLLLPHAGHVEEVSRWLHVGEFVIGGQLAGFLARVSEELVLSPESQERTLPCLVVGDAEGEPVDRDLGPANP